MNVRVRVCVHACVFHSVRLILLAVHTAGLEA